MSANHQILFFCFSLDRFLFLDNSVESLRFSTMTTSDSSSSPSSSYPIDDDEVASAKGNIGGFSNGGEEIEASSRAEHPVETEAGEDRRVRRAAAELPSSTYKADDASKDMIRVWTMTLTPPRSMKPCACLGNAMSTRLVSSFQASALLHGTIISNTFELLLLISFTWRLEFFILM